MLNISNGTLSSAKYTSSQNSMSLLCTTICSKETGRSFTVLIAMMLMTNAMTIINTKEAAAISKRIFVFFIYA
jgi:hypothetical protein